jgi:4-hydroxybutyryl-CoA dehydratase/vinylacetyl-CoA-Delta-isomerase
MTGTVAAMNGEQYKRTLADGRAIFMEGERVDDVVEHPILSTPVARTAEGYDWLDGRAEDGGSPLMVMPTNVDELRGKVDIVHSAGMLAEVTYTSVMTLATSASRLTGVSAYSERMLAAIEDARRRDIRITQCITDAKGDRSRHPSQQHDPDAYVRVVDRSPDGVVLRGAKLHITGAAVGHELLTIPTKQMRTGEEEYSIACLVPVNAEGVKIVNTTYAPRHEDVRSFPVSGDDHYPEGFVIFDDVFVPEERIFLDGEPAHAAVFAHSLGLWERLGGLTFMASGADLLVGLAQLIAEANGLAGKAHIKEKISDMIIHATVVRACLEAALSHAEVGVQGSMFPNELYTNAGKYTGAANYSLMVRHLHDIAGGSVATAPSVADLDNPEVGPLVRKYMGTGPEVDGAYRMRLFHTIRDLTADSYGGWWAITNLQAGGGLYAQRIVTRKHYDLEGARQAALKVAGLAE